MKNFISAGFGNPMSVAPKWMTDGVNFTSFGMRQDIPHGADADRIHVLVTDHLQRFGPHGIFAVAGWNGYAGAIDGDYWKVVDIRKNPCPPLESYAAEAGQLAFELKRNGMEDASIEVGNEVNIDDRFNDDDYKTFGRLVRECYLAIREHSDRIKVITGSAMSLMPGHGKEVTAKLCSMGFPEDTIQGVHPYRSHVEQSQAPGFDSVENMTQWVRDIAAPRGFAVTEIGWHTAIQVKKSGLFGSNKEEFQFTEHDIARFAKAELEAWKNAGSDSFNWYQIRDAEDPDPHNDQDLFGVYHADGRSKAQAHSLAAYKELERT